MRGRRESGKDHTLIVASLGDKRVGKHKSGKIPGGRNHEVFRGLQPSSFIGTKNNRSGRRVKDLKRDDIAQNFGLLQESCAETYAGDWQKR